MKIDRTLQIAEPMIALDSAPALPGVEFRATGLVITGNPTFDEWQRCGHGLSLMGKAVHWWIGDWLNYGEGKWGEMYAQALDEAAFEYQTLRNDKWVSTRIDLSRRRDKLSWSHHAEVAELEPEDQDILLGKAEVNGWTEKELRRQVRILRQRTERPVLVGSNPQLQIIEGEMEGVVPTLGTFDLVIADPPYNVTGWEWDKIGDADKYLDKCREWLDILRGAVKPEYHLFWFCSPDYMAETEVLLHELGLPVKSRVVWHRRNMAMGSDAKDKFVDSWEMIFHCGTKPLNYPDKWDDSRFDVQTVAVPQTNFTDQKLHPTQKPLALIKWLVDYGSWPGERVLDPFAGSGTTGEACLGTRSCVLVERNGEYVGVAKSRLGI